MFLAKLVPILFIILGAVNIIFPRFSWYMGVGWQFKNAEPSAAAIVVARVTGVIAVIVGILLLTSGIF